MNNSVCVNRFERFKSRGFTLVELVLVIAILGVLAVAALPLIFGIPLSTARTNSMKATAGAIQSSLSLYASRQLMQELPASFPATLDSVVSSGAPGTPATSLTPLFSNVLQGGVTDQWIKISNTCYVFDEDSSGTSNSGDYYFQYMQSSGEFIQISTCS